MTGEDEKDEICSDYVDLTVPKESCDRRSLAARGNRFSA